VDREIDDIQALIEVAGGPQPCTATPPARRSRWTRRYGSVTASPGLPCTNRPTTTTQPPRQAWRCYLEQLTGALAAGHHGDAVALFMAYVGTPAEQIDSMRQQDFWPAMAALGPTLAYDHTAILGTDAAVPLERAARLSVPALVLYGTASFPFMAETARNLQLAMPHGELGALEGQDHNVSPAALAPLLLELLT
jgi:pimeloyl-ACP methyl ester carboxylesterase